MSERMLDKLNEPTLSQIKEYIGKQSYERLIQFEQTLTTKYDLVKELRFPFGNNYGWGYKYSHKAAHLCYAFFERDSFTIMIQIGDKQVSKVEAIHHTLSKKSWQHWLDRYPCGEYGGWVNINVLDEHDLLDALEFVYVKKKPSNNKER